MLLYKHILKFFVGVQGIYKMLVFKEDIVGIGWRHQIMNDLIGQRENNDVFRFIYSRNIVQTRNEKSDGKVKYINFCLLI